MLSSTLSEVFALGLQALAFTFLYIVCHKACALTSEILLIIELELYGMMDSRYILTNKKQLMKLKGMAGPKSTQTRFVGIITSTIYIPNSILNLNRVFYACGCLRSLSSPGWRGEGNLQL